MTNQQRDRISIVVPTYNRAAWLAEALESLIRQETHDRFSFEIVVVDNGSTDQTASVVQQVARESQRPIHYFYEPRPGDAVARNAGVRVATGQWIAFFDDDQIADPQWLYELYDVACKRGAHVVGGPVHLLLTEEQYRWCGPLLRRLFRETRLYKRVQPYGPKHLPGTGNALVKRQVFDAVGMFREDFREGGSDIEFFDRARRQGYSVWYTPAAIIRHRVPPERFSPEYLRWEALSGGACQARQRDWPRFTKWGVLCLALARLAKASAYHLPAALLNRCLGRPGYALGHWTVIWRAEGYLYQTCVLFLPRLFSQQALLNWLDFRRGRDFAVNVSSASQVPKVLDTRTNNQSTAAHGHRIAAHCQSTPADNQSTYSDNQSAPVDNQASLAPQKPVILSAAPVHGDTLGTDDTPFGATPSSSCPLSSHSPCSPTSRGS